MDFGYECFQVKINAKLQKIGQYQNSKKGDRLLQSNVRWVGDTC